MSNDTSDKIGAICTIGLAGILAVTFMHDVHTGAEAARNLERKLKDVQTITVEKEVSVPTMPEPKVGNVIGGLLPDAYFITGTDENGNEQRAYLRIDGRLVEEYFR